MRRIILSILVGCALAIHFSSGLWSQDAKDGKSDVKDTKAGAKDAKGDTKDGKAEVKGEEKKDDKAEEKKNAKAEEKKDAKAEEKKADDKKPDEPAPPPVGDPSGGDARDKSWLTDSKLTDENKGKETAPEVASDLRQALDAIGLNRAAINMMWTLITGFLVMFMQAGFAMVETGLTRAKNVAHTMAMNLMIYALGMLGFYFLGFGLMFGNWNVQNGGSFLGGPDGLLTNEWTREIMGKPFGFFGTKGFMLMGQAFDSGIMALFLFQMVFMDTTATIPTGTMAERWKFLAFVIYGCIIGSFIYPIYGNWVWGGGWLSQLGAFFGLGHGHVDFAGSSVVHMTGGVCALAGGLIIGPRIGKYNKDGTVNVLPAHNVPMYMIGTFILAFGWFGFNPGSTLKGTDLNIARCAVNTMLASAAGAFSAMTYMWIVYKKPDPSFMCNGMLAGLVAITAPCAFLTPLTSVILGAVAGVVVIWSCLFWEKTAKIDDPVGAISVHGVCGMLGILAVGVLADGTYGQGWNSTFWYKVNDNVKTLELSPIALSGKKAGEAIEGIEEANKKNKEQAEKDGKKFEPVEVPAFLKKLPSETAIAAQGVTGALYGNTGQLKASLLGIVFNILWVFPVSFIMFKVIDLTLGLRPKPEDEIGGLDIPEMGVLGYIDEDPKTPEGHVLHPSMEPRSAKLPPDGKKRFTLLVEGLTPDKLAAIWGELCKPGKKPPAPEFTAVYPKMTTMTGNRFRFVDGNPDEIATQLTRLLQAQATGGGPIKVVVER